MQHSSVSRFNPIVRRRELVGVVVLIGASLLAGCERRPELLEAGDNSSVAQSGSASVAASGTEGSGVYGRDGSGAATVDICPAFALSRSFELARSAPDQKYVRCQTLGPESDWQGMVIAPDGRHIAARTGAGTVRLIATNPWHEVAHIASPLGALDAAAFSPDGKMLAVLSAEMGEVTLFRTADGKRFASFAGQPASTIDATASSLAYSKDGTYLATSLGVVIDTSGTVTSWKTGVPIEASLMPNPANLGLGEAIPAIAFTAGNTKLLVDTDYQIGNSPASTRLELREALTGQQTVLFDLYARALSGFALSPDGSKLALAITAEGAVGGFTPGLAIRDAVSGDLLVSDPSFTGRVLGFSRDGARLFTETALVVSTLAVDDLHLMSQFSWPDGTVFLGVSPAGQLVGTTPAQPSGGSTSWFDPATGAVVRSVGYPLQQIVWTSDGKLGAGTGDPAALFHLWRESEGGALCAPSVSGPPAPALAALGTFDDPNLTPTRTSDNGALTITNRLMIHTHSADWTALYIFAEDGSLLRMFGATGGGGRPIAMSHPSGARLYTTQGPDVAVWCR